MNPEQKGWLKEYLDIRKGQFNSGKDPSKHQQGQNPDQSLYSVVQPTGLMYGQPIHVHGDYEGEDSQWSDKDRLKVLMAESFINSAILFHTDEIKNADDFSEMILETTSGINTFYNSIYPELATPTKNFFGKQKSPLEVAEKILDKRISQNIASEDFWSNFFHNSLLFLDIFFFGQWVHANTEQEITEFFQNEKEELRFCVIKVLSAAAHANDIIEYEERKLFEYFINSAGLSKEHEEQAYYFLENGVSLEDIVVPSADSWILKKYFFELAILTIWSDKRVEDAEVEFLADLSKKLGLSEEDYDNSMVAIEGFVLQHWDELDALQGKKDYHAVSSEFIGRMSKITKKYKEKISSQISENSELNRLLTKLNKEGLEDAERIKLKGYLITVLNCVPSFVIISLPSQFLTLPVLLKILPEDLGGRNTA